MKCPFCSPVRELVAENTDALALQDTFPVTPGHTLVVPRRHVGSLFKLGEEELAKVWELVAEVYGILDHRHGPDGFNLGLNDGAAAGQTVQHAHVHLIPRFLGDVPDPRGGIRWVVPEKADYWSRQL